MGGFTEFYQEAYAPLRQEYRAAGSVSIDLMTARHGDVDIHDDYGSTFVLANVLRNEPGRALVDAGDGVREYAEIRNAPVFHPARTQCHYDVVGAHDIRLVMLPEAAVRASLDQVGIPDVSVLDRIAFCAEPDPMLARLMDEMWREAAARGASAALQVDALYHAILARLVRRAEAGPKRAPGPGRLTPRQVAHVVDVMEAHLDGSITVAMLAEAVGVPVPAFARAFKAATGETPHRFVIARRLERAKTMVLAGSEPLAEIAYACGFSSQSHMTALFSEHIGMPPGRYRKEATR
ncbi:MAG: AraC family transcriptional regulator [Pseudomonadota bacterium]